MAEQIMVQQNQEAVIDCLFIVGNDSNKEEVRASSAVLKASSRKFASLLEKNKSPGPLKIYYCRKATPDIFKKVIRFIDDGTLNLSGNFEEVKDLVAAAKGFQLPNLIEKLVSVGTVWLVLNSCSSAKMAAPCASVLMSRPNECLQHPTFRVVKLNSFLFFMRLKTADVKSDILITACNTRLNAKECSLELKEHLHLTLSILNCHFPIPRPVPSLTQLLEGLKPYPDALCYKLVLDWILKRILDSDSSNYNVVKVESAPEKVTLEFNVGEDVLLLGVELLSRKSKDTNPSLSGCIDYQENRSLQVESCDRSENEHQTLYESVIRGKKKYNSTYYVNFGTEIFVPRSTKCKMHVIINENVRLHRVRENNVVGAHFFTDDGGFAFETAQVHHKVSGKNGWTYSNEEACPVITKVYFKLVETDSTLEELEETM